MRQLLEARGFAVDCAGSVCDASRLLVKNRYDVVVSDYHLPDGHLGELIARARLEPSRTIVVSGTAAVATLPSEMLVFPKPVDAPLLLASVERVARS